MIFGVSVAFPTWRTILSSFIHSLAHFARLLVPSKLTSLVVRMMPVAVPRWTSLLPIDKSVAEYSPSTPLGRRIGVKRLLLSQTLLYLTAVCMMPCQMILGSVCPLRQSSCLLSWMTGCSMCPACAGVVLNTIQSSFGWCLSHITMGGQHRSANSGLKVLARTWQLWWSSYLPYVPVGFVSAFCRILQMPRCSFISSTPGAVASFLSVHMGDLHSKVVGPGGCLTETKLNGIVHLERLIWVLYVYVIIRTKLSQSC